MKYLPRLIIYAIIAVGAFLWIQHRRNTVLEHNRRVLAEQAAAEEEERNRPPEMCEHLQVLATRVNAEVTSCSVKDDWATVSLRSYEREAFTKFLWEVGLTGHAKIDKKDPTNYFRELRDPTGRQVFEHTFHLTYKPDPNPQQ